MKYVQDLMMDTQWCTGQFRKAIPTCLSLRATEAHCIRPGIWYRVHWMICVVCQDGRVLTRILLLPMGEQPLQSGSQVTASRCCSVMACLWASWNPAPVMNPWTDSELGQYCVGKPRLSRPGLYVLRLTEPCSSHWVDTVIGKVQQLRSVWVMSMLWMAASV